MNSIYDLKKKLDLIFYSYFLGNHVRSAVSFSGNASFPELLNFLLELQVL